MSQIIHIDGIDRSAKSTIRKLLIKATFGRVLVLVRTFMSQIVYSRIYNRNIDERWFKDQMIHAYKRGEKFFLFTASNEIIKQRCLDTKETDIKPEDIVHHKEQFNKLVDELEGLVDVEIIDTSVDSTETILDKILERIGWKI